MSSVAHPPFDSALVRAAAEMGEIPQMGPDTYDMLRQAHAVGIAGIADDLAKYDVTIQDRTIEGPRGEITLSVISPRGGVTNAPGLYYVHGGGMIVGDRFSVVSASRLIEWVQKYQLVLVTVEHRLPPEFPGRGAVDDCQAGLAWMAANASGLGIDPNRIILSGVSGGGGIAAGTALLNRDLGGPRLLAQALWCPQLDDRTDYSSAQQFTSAAGTGYFWPRETHEFAWNMVLGEGHETQSDVSAYIAANRADNLSELPPTFIDVGANEVFRDPAVEYATKLWAAGVDAELHVWPGAFHGFDAAFPGVPVSQASLDSREDWLRRTLLA